MMSSMSTSTLANNLLGNTTFTELQRRQAREALEAAAILAAGLEQDMLLPAEGVAKAASISVSHFYALLSAKRAPAADVRLGPRCVRWRASTVRTWLVGLAAQPDEKAAA